MSKYFAAACIALAAFAPLAEAESVVPPPELPSWTTSPGATKSELKCTKYPGKEITMVKYVLRNSPEMSSFVSTMSLNGVKTSQMQGVHMIGAGMLPTSEWFVKNTAGNNWLRFELGEMPQKLEQLKTVFHGSLTLTPSELKACPFQ